MFFLAAPLFVGLICYWLFFFPILIQWCITFILNNLRLNKNYCEQKSGWKFLTFQPNYCSLVLSRPFPLTASLRSASGSLPKRRSLFIGYRTTRSLPSWRYKFVLKCLSPGWINSNVDRVNSLAICLHCCSTGTIHSLKRPPVVTTVLAFQMFYNLK